MSFNLLQYQIKTVRAKEDISEGRLRMRGPQMVFVVGDRATPVKPGWKKLWREQGRGAQIDPLGYTKLVDEGETLEVDQAIARKLVLEGKCELVAGGAFSVFEGRDVPLVEMWFNRLNFFGSPHQLFQSVETVEVMTDVFNLGPGCPVPRGTVMRVRSIDFFCGCGPKSCTWADEELKEGHLRILRPSPVSKQVALRQQEQSALLTQLWGKVFPDKPIVGVGAVPK
jgi:hypothetical protein